MSNCILINRNYPPHNGITGNSADELSSYLKSRGILLDVVTLKSFYPGCGSNLRNSSNNIYRLKSLYNGKNKIIRLFSCIFEGWRLCRKAFFLRPSFIISMSDPPMLNFWVARIAKKMKIPWIYWSMDLYPEAFAASNLITEKNLFYRLFINYLAKYPPLGLIALGYNQSIHIQKSLGQIPYKVVLPCGIKDTYENINDIPKWKKNNQKIIIAYVGNLGEAHDDSFVTSVINKIDPKSHMFILSVYGSKSKPLIEFAQNKPGVLILKTVPSDHLRFIDIHVVTLMPKWTNVCLPSKAYSAVSQGCCLLLNCSRESDLFKELNAASWFIGHEDHESLENLFQNLNIEQISKKKHKALSLAKDLQSIKSKAFNQISQILKKV